MDRNAFLAIALSTLVFMTWATWQARNQPLDPAPGTQPGTETSEPAPSADPVENIRQGDLADESIRQREPLQDRAAPDSTAPAPEPTEVASGDAVELWERTLDLGRYRVDLTNRGGAVTAWTLARYFERTDAGEIPVQLLSGAEELGGALATPLRELGMGDLRNALFEVVSADDQSVVFRYERGGVAVVKTFTFDRESYGFRLTLSVENASDRVVSPRFDVMWPAARREGSDFSEQSLAALVDGGVERELVSGLGVPGFFGGGERRIEHRGNLEWAGVDNRYFLAALIADRARTAEATFEAIEPGELGELTLAFAPVDIPPGQKLEHQLRGFAGPKRPGELSTVADVLELAINRGWSWMAPLTRFFEWTLEATYSVIPNYGFAIIVLTILVRLVMTPIMSRQMKSMERMRAIQPKLKEIQEKFADDRQKQSEAMMSLYRSEGVNPLGGCLPMLLQFPVFIGLFYALQSSFELRHASFMLWIDDLSAPESLFTLPGLDLPVRVLPLIMGASMVVQQRLTPTTIDPAQARMMMTIMPIMFTVLFYQFPSGLVLYWMVSNVLGIAHQLWVGRSMRAEATA